MKIKFYRLIAAWIDHTLFCLVGTSIVGIITVGSFDANVVTVSVYVISYFLLILSKDLICKNASIGKRIFKIKVVRTDGSHIRTVDLIKRNLPILFILPIEIFMVMINTRRFGDLWSKTVVIADSQDA